MVKFIDLPNMSKLFTVDVKQQQQSFAIVFQSYQDKEKAIMKGLMQ